VLCQQLTGNKQRLFDLGRDNSKYCILHQHHTHIQQYPSQLIENTIISGVINDCGIKVADPPYQSQ